MIRKLFPLKSVKPPKNTLWGELNSVHEWTGDESWLIVVDPIKRYGFNMFKATVATKKDYLYDPNSSFGFSRLGWTEEQARERVLSALRMWQNSLQRVVRNRTQPERVNL